MPAEPEAHRGKHLVGEGVLDPAPIPGKQRSGKDHSGKRGPKPATVATCRAFTTRSRMRATRASFAGLRST